MQWIALKDKLPPLHTSVIVYDGLDVYVDEFDENPPGPGWWRMNPRLELFDVIWWMPLPVLPDDGEEKITVKTEQVPIITHDNWVTQLAKKGKLD